MNELVGFLRARLDEDEAVARAATPGPWSIEGDEDGMLIASPTETIFDDEGGSIPPTRQDADHIARHDPARVLREVEAKRYIIEAAEEASNLDMSADLDRRVGARDEAAEPYVGTVILWALASAYSDHPDYDFGWAPDTSPVARRKP